MDRGSVGIATSLDEEQPPARPVKRERERERRRGQVPYSTRGQTASLELLLDNDMSHELYAHMHALYAWWSYTLWCPDVYAY